MFDAEADGKRFGFHRDATFVKHLEGIPRAVSRSEDDMIRMKRSAVLQNDSLNLSIFDNQVVDPAFVVILSAE